MNGGAVINACSEVSVGGANDGAVIHCGDLPPSPLEFGADLPAKLFPACLVAGNNSTIRNLTVCNGEAVLQRNPPVHRNGIVIRPGTEAVVEEVRLINTRRGVLGFTESLKATGVTVRNSLIEGSELAGIFLWARGEDGLPTNNSQLRGEIKANRLSRIGLHPLLLNWSAEGSDNDSHAEFIENIVDSTNVRVITIELFGPASDTAAPAQFNRASFAIEGGRLEGSLGLLISARRGANNFDNCLAGRVEGLTITNGQPAVSVSTAGWGNANRFLLEMTGSVYSAPGPRGEVSVTDDAGSDFLIRGTAKEFSKNNKRFDISGVDPVLDFTFGEDNCVFR